MACELSGDESLATIRWVRGAERLLADIGRWMDEARPAGSQEHADDLRKRITVALEE